MIVHKWLRPRFHIFAIFVGVAVVSAAALAWLMWLLLEQDKAVEAQRRQERLQQAADRAVATMQAAVAELDHLTQPGAGLLLVRVRPTGLDVTPPTGLLFVPNPKPQPEAPASLFADADRAEFARRDWRAAAEIYTRLAADRDKTIRSAALTGLARVYRGLHDPEAALRTYAQLSENGLSNTGVMGLPAGLVAHEGRATTLAEIGRSTELRQEAAEFERNLRSGRWQITKSQYAFYSAEVAAWLGSTQNTDNGDAVALAEAVTWLWENRHDVAPDSRHLIWLEDRGVLVVLKPSAEGVEAAVAGPSYLSSLCRDAVSDLALRCMLTDAEGHAVAGETSSSHTTVIRTTAETRLPWTLHVSGTESTDVSVSPRRSLLLWVAVVLTLVWLTGAVFIVRAITRETRVAQLQSDFVAAVSHEFRTPLSSLCQISEMLATDRLDSSVRRDAYGVLVRETERLRGLVEGLLDFGRFEAGAAIYRFESMEIGAFLKTIVSEFQQRVASLGYNLELRACDQSTLVKADREALGRAVVNLLDNAVKYSPDCRTVWVDVEIKDHRVLIVVRDHGLGIPIHEQSQIFEKFVRGADSKTRRIKGTGIGLAMVRHIVQAHGGEITLSSRPGEGSRFTMALPEVVQS